MPISPAKNINSLKPRLIYLIIVLIALIGILTGWLLSDVFNNHAAASNSACTSELKFIRPNTNCEFSEHKKQELNKLDGMLEAKANEYVESGKAKRVGVFVRDMKSTHFAGVNETDNFYGASLLKLPLIIAGYKQAEVNPAILGSEILYNGTVDLDDKQNVKVKDQLVPGKKYTFKDLMDRSVIYSDNTSAEIVYKNLPRGFFDLILSAVGIQYRLSDGSEEILIAPRTYANLFRLLYNTSYLTAEYSDQVLETLTRVDYREGAMKKLPKSVKVAHKFAERAIEDPRTKKIKIRQLHECGLVYLNDGTETYSFCIMTEGENFEDLETIQQDVSKLIYDSMNAQIQ